jgi:hypothetical protein
MKHNGKNYVYDGKVWICADDFTHPPSSVRQQLERLLSDDDKLEIKMAVKRSGDLELRHFFAYHSPEVMGCTAEECDGLGFLTSKDFGDPIGDVLWFVGKAPKVKRYFLRSYYVIEGIGPSNHPDFDHSLFGSDNHAGLFDPMPELTTLQWFQEYFPRTTCAQGRGMDIMEPSAVGDFKKVAAKAGCPFAY